MIKQEYKYGSFTVETLQLVKIYRLLEKEANTINRTGYANLSMSVILKDKTTVDVSKSKEVEAVLEEEIENIHDVRIRFYSSELDVSLEQNFVWIKNPIRVGIKAKSRDKLIVLKDFIERELARKRNMNWLVSSWLIPYMVIVILLTATQFGIINAITDEPLPQNTRLLLGFMILIIDVGLATFFSNLLKMLYPTMVLKAGQKKSGREFNRDFWVFLVVIAIPIAINYVQ